jgi:hypothetical protein
MQLAASELKRISLRAMFVALGEEDRNWQDFIPFFRARHFVAPVFFLRDERAETVERILNLCDIVILVSEFSASGLGTLPISTAEEDSLPEIPPEQSARPPASPKSQKFQQARDDYEIRVITSALRLHRGNVSDAAQHLGIGRRNLHYKIRAFGINLDTFRVSDSEQKHTAPQEHQGSQHVRFRRRRSSAPVSSDLSNPS